MIQHCAVVALSDRDAAQCTRLTLMQVHAIKRTHKQGPFDVRLESFDRTKWETMDVKHFEEMVWWELDIAGRLWESTNATIRNTKSCSIIRHKPQMHDRVLKISDTLAARSQ